MSEPVNKVCATCAEKCKQAEFAVLAGCSHYKRAQKLGQDAQEGPSDARKRVRSPRSMPQAGTKSEMMAANALF